MTQSIPDWNAAIDRLDGAYAPATLRAYRGDFAVFAHWCETENLPALPASPETVAAFIAFHAQNLCANTVRRRLNGIRKVHRLLRMPNPCDDEEVLIAMRRAYRKKGMRARQALGLTRDIKAKLIDACDLTSMVGLRNRAIIMLAYDVMCRRSEISALEVEDLTPCDDGGLTLLVRRTKSDPLGEGRLAYASPATRECVEAWLAAAGIKTGPLFRGVRNGRIKAQAINPASVNTIIKTVAADAGLPAETVEGLSGHSARIGAAQDLVCDGADLIAIMTAGRWKSVATVARYVEAALVRRVGVERLQRLVPASTT